MVKRRVRAVSASQACRQRMLDAKKRLPESVGQQAVMEYVAEKAPELDKLTNATRWHNAWLGRVADPEFTDLVEKAASHFSDKDVETADRLKRFNMKKATN
ncbi:hypothetical protein M0L20_13765 [Spirosoma sp. RP8]|uniref:Uncharacterized protein n=1 Tax=Spirosoma liriopis TaxID=2937440 RepID=A0ABT0HL78_9BACT|nr:hypothetical protein [Spirosoma liriopis]MCK8492930.1 hypothetical protein [Spirosoma liriopis]